MRLQKYLAQAGVASRRKSEEYIKEGRVKVNGQVVNELGYKITPETDRVEFDNERISIEQKPIYILLNKPVGYVTTVKDPFHRKTVMDIVNQVEGRIYPVGRLDYDTEGLLIMTNDGELTYRLTHPKHEIKKEYIATVKGIPSQKEMKAFENGLKIDDYITSPAKINILNIKKGNAWVKVVIHEGKNRQIRKMCDKIGHPIIHLKRVKMGEISLGNLPVGNWRYLRDEEVCYLKKI